ncbi:MAG: type II secretion system GspH family protein [Alphaproteobacteria bacterium]|nr:type II secretion system GspH family protein [Alphaproteobacteria bacterium]
MPKKMSQKQKQAEGGFTLVELAVVLIISGIIIAFLSSTTLVALKNAKVRELRNKMEFIQGELSSFLETHGRLPCPASLQAALDDSEFGVEALSDCTLDDAIPGLFRTSGTNGKQIRIGAIPVRSLNLLDDYIYDPHKTRFLYAITEDLTKTDSYDFDGGAITINDKGGNTITDNAHYVLISPGENRLGGYESLTGVLIGGDACDSSDPPFELENCDHDSVFISSLKLSDTVGDDYFDDYLRTYSTSDRIRQMPAGSVVFFDLLNCPQGWQNFVPNPFASEGLISCKKN